MAEETGSDRVALLLAEVGLAPTIERAKEKSEELVRALVTFYGDGLERVLDIVHEAAGDRSEAVFAALCEDRYVENLLALHDLHPLPLEDRVLVALEGIRPYLESHEGDVELVRVEGGIAYVRLSGSCDGCQSSAATLKNAVETAILERVSEIREVRAEGAEAPLVHSLKLQSDWVALESMPALATTGIARISCAGTPVVLARHDGTFYAYRDACPVCTLALDGATLAWPVVRCVACGNGFDVVRAGRCVENEHRSAEPFPLVHDGERVRISIPLSV